MGILFQDGIIPNIVSQANISAPYILGLDLGISSVGWSVVEVVSTSDLSPKRLIDAGSRVFPAAENPKNGESLNVQTRLARSQRKRLKRRKKRLKKAHLLLNQTLDLSDSQVISISKPDVWTLRVRALDQIISNLDLARVLYHLIKHRGYKSSRLDETNEASNDEDLSSLKQALQQNEQELSQYRSFGEMIVTRVATSSDLLLRRKRNTTGIYLATPLRSQIEGELLQILKTQRALGNQLISDSFIANLTEILNDQNAFATRESIEEMVGPCSLIPEEKRAPKNSVSFQEFQNWQTLRNTRVVNIHKSSERSLTEKECSLLFSNLEDKKLLTYKQARKILSLSNQDFFKGLRYGLRGKKGEFVNPETKAFLSNSVTFEIQKVVQEVDEKIWHQLRQDTQLLDCISLELTLCPSSEELLARLSTLALPPSIATSISKLPKKSGFAHLSFKAIYRLLPLLKQGFGYTDSCEKAGLSLVKHQSTTTEMPPISQSDIRNPVVLRSASQARKVIKAIVAKYGPPLRVHLELARDMSRSYGERKRYEREQIERRSQNETDKLLMAQETGCQTPTGTQLLKWRLWKEQLHQCAYSGKPITREMVLDETAVQVDHAIPFSRSLNDTYLNKVLVITAENQEKRNLTPYEYLSKRNDMWRLFEARISSWNIPYKKKMLLLKTNVPQSVTDAEMTFAGRDLNDTRYICRFMRQYIDNHVPFRLSERRKVVVFPGAVTSYFRWKWGLEKDRSNDRHHAVDAVVLACTSSSMLQKVVQWAKLKEKGYANAHPHFPEPWPEFHHDVKYRLLEDRIDDFWTKDGLQHLYGDIPNSIRSLLVSKMISRKVSGKLHKDTMYSVKSHATDGTIITKKLMTTPQPITLKNGLVVLQRREPVIEKTDSFSKLPRGNSMAAAPNASIHRIDIYTKDKGFYFCPVYNYQILKNELPDRLVRGGKPLSEWIIIDNTYSFLFSLHSGEYVKLVKRDGTELEGYFVKANRASGNITLSSHDNSVQFEGIGVKTLRSIKKYVVDPLGNMHEVRSERLIV